MSSRCLLPLPLTAAVLWAAAGAASAAPPQLPRAIFTKIPGHPTAVVPGAREPGGNPVLTYFKSIESLAVSPDGTQWALTARTTQDSTVNIVLLVGSGITGSVLCQEGQPFRGGLPGEEYFIFQAPNPVAWNSAGDLLFTARARAGNAAKAQKVVRVTGGPAGTHAIIHQQGDPAPGLIDDPPGASGNETFGQGFTSLFLFDDGTASFRISPINNLSPARWPAIYHGTTPFRQAGVSPIGAESWDNFIRDGSAGTPDGAHWLLAGAVSSPDTFTDDILVVDDQMVMRESSPAAPGAQPMSHVLNVRMQTTGDWFARGDDYSGGHWAVRSGVLAAQTGTTVVPGSPESWDTVLYAVHGNRLGHWVVAGRTYSGSGGDEVIVLNGRKVVVREGDPVDLNGNGLADDDAFIGRANPSFSAFTPDNCFLADDLVLYFIANLRNAAGQDLNTVPVYGPPTALLRVQLFCPADYNGDGFVDGIDSDQFNNDFEAGNPAADYNGDGFVDGIDYDLFNNDFANGC